MAFEKTTDTFQVEDVNAVPVACSHSNLSIRIIKDCHEILSYQQPLIEFSAHCGQPGAMDHLEYFLSSEQSLKKHPYLLLIGSEHRSQHLRDVIGAVLIYEYRLLGCGTGIFVTDDICGRRTLIALPDQRMHVARLAAETLMRKGARLVLQSLSYSSLDQSLELPVYTSDGRNRWVYATHRRGFSSYMPFENTMNATLAKMKQKTRFNLRYYRRRAEAELQCSFVANVSMDRVEFQAFNRQCSYAVKDARAVWRYDTVMGLPGMFLYGVKSGDGDWLSIVGGRRYGDAVEIDWQMNRSDLPTYSLSTVMRAYFMEHEIARGTRKMYIEGGTPHAMRHSFVKEIARDLIVVKHRWLLWLLRTLPRRFVPPRNFLMETLRERRLPWHPWF